MDHRSRLPFLLALVVGLAAMDLTIFRIDRQEVGTVRWDKARVSLSLLTATAETDPPVSRWRQRVQLLLGDETGSAALDMLTAGLAPHVSRMKVIRQAQAELAQELRAAQDAKDIPTFDRVAASLEQVNADNEREQRVQAAMLAAGHRPDPDMEAGEVGKQKAGVGDAKATAWKSAGVGSISGEMLQAVYRAGISNSVDPRLLAAASGLNETVPSEGGFLVGTDMAAGIKQRMYEVGEILKRVFKLPLGPNSNGIKVNMVDETSRANGSRYGGIVSYWLAEAAEKTASKPKFRQALLELKKVAALVYGTDELLQDSTALEAWIQKFLPLELQFKVEDAIINGTGAGQPLGILNSGGTVSVTRANAGAIDYTDVSNMWARMYAPSRKNAVWHVEQGVEGSLEVLNIPIGTGGSLAPVYKPAGTLPGQEFATLYGRPIIPTEYNAALGTVGDIILADWDEYTLIEKGGVQSASSMHVRFVFDETAFRFVYRVDGQPNSNAALTPKSGGATLSSFVTLAT